MVGWVKMRPHDIQHTTTHDNTRLQEQQKISRVRCVLAQNNLSISKKKQTYVLLNGPWKLRNIGIGDRTIQELVVCCASGRDGTIKGLCTASSDVLVLCLGTGLCLTGVEWNIRVGFRQGSVLSANLNFNSGCVRGDDAEFDKGSLGDGRQGQQSRDGGELHRCWRLCRLIGCVDIALQLGRGRVEEVGGGGYVVCRFVLGEKG